MSTGRHRSCFQINKQNLYLNARMVNWNELWKVGSKSQQLCAPQDYEKKVRNLLSYRIKAERVPCSQHYTMAKQDLNDIAEIGSITVFLLSIGKTFCKIWNGYTLIIWVLKRAEILKLFFINQNLFDLKFILRT